LLDQEDRSFPSRHCEVMASVLANWGFPATVFQPLHHCLSRYEELSTLGEPLRTKAELCKAAAFLGRLAVGRFEAWDVVEPIPGSVLARFNLRAARDLVIQTRANLARINPVGESSGEPKPNSPWHAVQPGLGYVSLASRRGDFLSDILDSMGLAVQQLDPECLAMDRYIIVNCLDVPARRLAPYLGSGLFADRRLIVTERRHLDEYKSLGTAMAVPASYAALRAACEGVARAQLARDQGVQSQEQDSKTSHASQQLATSSPAGTSHP
jgi:hypothetical protein